MSGHSKWSPSSAKRWMACPASIKAAAAAPVQPPSVYARKGTSVAKAVEAVITDGQKLEDMVGRPIEGVVFQAEDIEPLRIYLNTLDDLQRTGDTLHIEQRLDLSRLWPGLYGHADAVAVGETLTICDLKWGEGVYVDHIDNPQLLIYALGALLAFDIGQSYQFVDLVICQPRFANGEPLRSRRIPVAELWFWAASSLLPALRATEAEDPIYKPGDYCRFCPAKAECPALRAFALADAQATFTPATALTGAELADVLDKASIVESFINAVREEAMARLQRNEDVPGYVLGVGRTTREWEDEERAASWMAHYLDLKESDLFETKIRSPAQIEKRIPRHRRDELKPLIALKPGGAKLVKADTARAPLPSRIDENYLPSFIA